jgi:hypothetical protein
MFFRLILTDQFKYNLLTPLKSITLHQINIPPSLKKVKCSNLFNGLLIIVYYHHTGIEPKYSARSPTSRITDPNSWGIGTSLETSLHFKKNILLSLEVKFIFHEKRIVRSQNKYNLQQGLAD